MKLLSFTRKDPTFSIILILFSISEVALCGTVLSGAGSVRAEQYSAIGLACALALLYTTKQPQSILTSVALAFTLLADYFLVMRETQLRMPAMIAFCIVQITYAARLLSSLSRKARLIHISLRLLTVAVAETVCGLILRSKADALSVISVFYYANLVANCVTAFVSLKKSPLFAVGLFLFLLCDTVIGLNVVSAEYIELPSAFSFITDAETNLAWLFYIPSQTLIALSAALIAKEAPNASGTQPQKESVE